MNKDKEKSALEKIKDVLGMGKQEFSEEKPTEKKEESAEQEQKFVAVTLSDGTLIQIEPEVQEGATVMIEDAERGFVPVPDGAYELEDKRIVTVVDGVITAIEQVAEEEEAAVEETEDMEADKAPVMTEKEVRKIIESVETHFKSEIETLKEEIVEFKKAEKEKNELFVSALEEVASDPVQKPIEKKKNGYNFKQKKKSIFEREVKQINK